MLEYTHKLYSRKNPVRQILIFLLMYSALFASGSPEDAHRTAIGTEQEIITQLLPQPDAANVSRYAAMSVTFSVPLDERFIKQHDVTLRLLSYDLQSEQHPQLRALQPIAGALTYTEHAVTFTPDSVLVPGIYEITYNSLKTTETAIRPIRYRFTVVKELLESIDITPDPILLKADDTAQLMALGHYDSGMQREITALVHWSVADGSVAAIDEAGVLSALAEGNTTLTAALDNISASLPLEVRHQFELLSPAAGQSIPYSYVTLEVNASRCDGSVAVNERLVAEQNRTSALKGALNDGFCYFYNVPLLAGDNAVTIADGNGTASKSFTLFSEGLGYPPIGMRAGAFSGVGTLQTTVKAGTSLDTATYLFDADGDGSIDAVSSDGIFSVDFNREGRYRPRVTVRTTENLLFSSNDYALSLDVKATADQFDPAGAEPVDVAKAFVAALIENDRQKLEKFTMMSQRLLEFIYDDEPARLLAIERAKRIDENSWQQTYDNNGGATATAKINDPDLGEIQIGFDMSIGEFYEAYNGRIWVINAFY